MSDRQSASRKFLPRDYRGQQVTVTYDIKRCLHAAECVRRAPAAFDKDRRPWIMPDADSVEAVVAAVLACPTGALRFERKDARQVEQVPAANIIWVVEDGPLYLRGNIEIVNGDGELLHRDTRLALCRCGQSANKPFCDNAHLSAGFRAAGVNRTIVTRTDSAATGGRLRVIPSPDGSYKISGAHTLFHAAESANVEAEPIGISLCRCGQSGSKPYCDGSHRRVAFRDPGW